MNFRSIDYNKDIPEVVQLIRDNLDDSISHEFFTWKHLQNPFGKSYGLLASDGEKIIGLRMFMFWKFLNSADRRILTAIRPVDTVVDQNYRGRGLFKKLTLAGLEECKEDYEFIFNTPNENSLPGYLKMGWQKHSNVNLFRIAVRTPSYKSSPLKIVEADSIQFKECYKNSGKIKTLKSSEYIKWRYKNKKYKIAYFRVEEVYVVYSISKKAFIIIYEIFGDLNSVSNKMFNSICRKYKKPFIYYYCNEDLEKLKFPLTIKRQKPVIVLKEHEEFLSPGGIDFSLADLEAAF